MSEHDAVRPEPVAAGQEPGESAPLADPKAEKTAKPKDAKPKG